MTKDISYLYVVIGKKTVENEALSTAVKQLSAENETLKTEIKELTKDGDRPNEES